MTEREYAKERSDECKRAGMSEREMASVECGRIGRESKKSSRGVDGCESNLDTPVARERMSERERGCGCMRV